MSDLSGQVVLVTGATGEVGWGFAHAARDAGATVVLPTRSAERRQELADEFGTGRAVPIHADIGTHAGRRAVLEAAQSRGGLHHVFAPIGAWWQKGDSLGQPDAELEELLATYVRTPFSLVRDCAPLLAATRGSYTLVTGAAGERVHRGIGLLVVAVRGQYALSEVLRAEARPAPFRLNELRIATRIERQARPGAVPSREAGASFVRLLTSDVRSEIVPFPLPGSHP